MVYIVHGVTKNQTQLNNFHFHHCRYTMLLSSVEFLLKNQLIGILLYVIWCFSPVAFNIFSLYLIFINLISIFLCVFLLQFILAGILFFSWTWVTVLYLRDVFSYYLLNYFLKFFLFSCGPSNKNVGVFNILLEIRCPF